MDVGHILRLIALDLAVIITPALLIGWWAPRWPDRWLDRDLGPQRLTRVDRPSHYRSAGVTWLARKLPEGGEWFGGQSKSALPGRDRASLERYLIEVRRGEWVHMLAMFVWIPLIFFNPLWLTVCFAVFVVGGNAIFLLVLRYNRLRILSILARSALA